MQLQDLIEHPEGGRYQEVYRSASLVQTADKGERCSITHIYFSLESHEFSRFHRVSSDEIWNLYQGQGLRLFLWDGVSSEIDAVELSSTQNSFCHVVPANYWQAAMPLAGKVLVGCSVAPGFEFADFELITPDSEVAHRLKTEHPELAQLV